MSGADTYCSIPLQRAVCGFGDITIGWISVRFDTDILVPLGMNFNFILVNDKIPAAHMPPLHCKLNFVLSANFLSQGGYVFGLVTLSAE